MKTDTKGTLKKKSIFSPDNSSESDTEDSNHKSTIKESPKAATPILRGKSRVRKASIEKPKNPVTTTEKKEEKPVKDNNNVKRRSGTRWNGPPPKKVVEVKASASSCTSSQSSSDLDTAESDSEPNAKKEAINKLAKTKTPPIANKTETKVGPLYCSLSYNVCMKI